MKPIPSAAAESSHPVSFPGQDEECAWPGRTVLHPTVDTPNPILPHPSPIPSAPTTGGVLYGSHGAELLFRLSGLAILGCTAAAAVPALVLRRQRKRRTRELPPSKESVDDLAALAQH